MRSYFRAAVAAAYLFGLVLHTPVCAQLTSDVRSKVESKRLLEGLAMAFEQNRGQADPAVKYLSRGPGYQVFLTAEEAVVAMAAAVVRMRFDGANRTAVVKGEDLLDHKTNYLRSADPAKNITDVSSHAKVKYGVGLPGDRRCLLRKSGPPRIRRFGGAGAKTEKIKISFPGADKVSVSKEGDLLLAYPEGDVRYLKPVAYQDIDGRRETVAAEYLVAQGAQVGFRIGEYDRSKPLVIDPILSYSSPLWGQYITGLAMDSLGNAYVVGDTRTSNVPASGGYLTRLSGIEDVYVAKFDASGTWLYATYLGARRGSTTDTGSPSIPGAMFTWPDDQRCGLSRHPRRIPDHIQRRLLHYQAQCDMAMLWSTRPL